MITPTRLIVSDLNRTFEIHDNLGRSLKVRRINALDRLRLLKAAGPDLSQNDAWLNMAALVMSLMEINGAPGPLRLTSVRSKPLLLNLGIRAWKQSPRLWMKIIQPHYCLTGRQRETSRARRFS